MAVVDVGDAAMAGPRVVMSHPVAVLVWGLMVMGFLVLALLVFGGGVVSAIITLAQSPGGSPDPSVIFGLVGSVLGFYFVLLIGMIIIGTTISAAAMRAVLEPGYGGFAYLRFGRQELWMMLALFVQALVIAGVEIAVSIPVSILTLAAGAGMGHGGEVGAALAVRLVGQLLVYVAAIWVWLRLSMAAPMTFVEGRFRLFESWDMTKGHAGSIFLTFLIVGVVTFVLYVVFAAVGFAVGAATLTGGPLLANPKAFFSQPTSAWLIGLGPLALVILVFGTVIMGFANTFNYAALARLYRQLNPESDAASAFT
jgi:hypothetical protein